MTSIVPEPDSAALLAGATLFAMTRFAEAPCAEQAGMVVRHLECVACDPASDERLRKVCTALARRWRHAMVTPGASQHVGAARK
ncbi:hypothetical protein ACDA63_08735 [Uliginosibacterium sp. sgz301328]|uniref:hypothetical protein n=1 Tax=Uliginosibacterium sp. sgz301328 TaxID=3243764 RepID=UPI00359D9DE9